MAKFSATAIVFFCLFTITVAHNPPENDDDTALVSFPLSDVNDPSIRLPSNPVNAENSDSPDNSAVTSVPLNFATFRPINRRFFVRSKHPCRRHFKVDHSMREHVEIPYGNDMIVSTAENSDSEDPEMTHVGPLQRVRLWRKHHHDHHLHHHEDSDSDDENDDHHHHHHLHHHEDSDSDDENDDQTVRMVFRRHDYDRFNPEKKLKVLKQIRKQFRQQSEEQTKTREEGGFMNRVRKFLDPLF